MAAFPDLADQWGELIQKVRGAQQARLQELADKRQAEELLGVEREEEELRLSAQVAKNFEPIVLYRIQYGAKIEGEQYQGEDVEELEIYSDSVIVLDDQPDKDGWYYSIHNSEITRTKLPNVIRIDELLCNVAEDVPPQVFSRSRLVSKKFRDIYIYQLSIPPEVTRLAEVE